MRKNLKFRLLLGLLLLVSIVAIVIFTYLLIPIVRYKLDNFLSIKQRGEVKFSFSNEQSPEIKIPKDSIKAGKFKYYIPSGKHSIYISKEGIQNKNIELDIKKASNQKIEVTLFKEKNNIVVGTEKSFSVYSKTGDILKTLNSDKRFTNYKYSADGLLVGVVDTNEESTYKEGYQLNPIKGILKIYDTQTAELKEYSELGEVYNFDFGSGEEIYFINSEFKLKKVFLSDTSKVEDFGPDLKILSLGNIPLQYTKDGVFVITEEKKETTNYTYYTFITADNANKSVMKYNLSGEREIESFIYKADSDLERVLYSSYSVHSENPQSYKTFSPATGINIAKPDCKDYCSYYGLNYYSLYETLPQWYIIRDIDWYEEGVCFSIETEIVYCNKLDKDESKPQNNPFKKYISSLDNSNFDIYGNQIIYFKNERLVLSEYSKDLADINELNKFFIQENILDVTTISFIE